MHIRRFAAAACLSLIALVAAPQFGDAAETGDPPSIVREIYLQFEDDGALFDVPEKYFSPALLDLWREVEGASDGDVESALGFPVFNNEGDDETITIDDIRFQFLAKKYVIASYIVLVDEEDAIAATKKYFQYNFEDTAAGWKIDDIDWGPDKQTLRQYLNEIKAMRAMK